MGATRKTNGAVIRARREDLGVTLPTLAERVGITKGGLSKIENGHVQPRTSTLFSIATALGVDLDDISTRADESVAS
jgi:transcriptional regulator with XRE-family HTH domain